MRHVRVILPLGFVLYLTAATAFATTVTFSDSTFPNANWTVPDALNWDPAQTGQRGAGGNPGAYRQTGVIFAQRPDYAAELNTTFVYNPSTQGAITAISYTFDVKAISAIGSVYAPLLSQNGTLFYDPLSTAYNSENKWTTYNLLPQLTDFVPLHGGAATPDFVNGSAITFGYIVSSGGAGFYESITGIDNDPITLTTNGTGGGGGGGGGGGVVPEPASALLLGTGLLSAVLALRLEHR